MDYVKNMKIFLSRAESSHMKFKSDESSRDEYFNIVQEKNNIPKLREKIYLHKIPLKISKAYRN